jgi:hypothetical protein
VSRLLSSARVRRRLLWLAGFLGLASVVAILIVVIKNPPPPPGEKTSPGGTLVKPDVNMAFGPHSDQVLGLAQQFVLTAVRRNHVDQSWEMVCPEMRQGYTKASWSKGEIPVVPFPASFAKWHLAYSYEREIDLQVALYAKPERKLKPVVFDLTLHPCGAAKANRWLVSSFIPTPSASGDFGSTDGGEKTRLSPLAIGTRNPSLYQPASHSPGWLALPLGIAAGMLFIALAIVGVVTLRGRRAYNSYVRERRMAGGPKV